MMVGRKRDHLILVLYGDEMVALEGEAAVTYLAQWNHCHCIARELKRLSA